MPWNNNKVDMMEKMNCYDPRINKDVETDNPALVLGSFMPRLLFDKEHWKRIAWLADYCDEMVDPEKEVSRVFNRYMKSICPGCKKEHRSPLSASKEYVIGDRICRITCSCGYRFCVIYNTTLKHGEDQDPLNQLKEGYGGNC